MIFIFTILLIETYIQINYYYDKNHANSTVITQYGNCTKQQVYSTLCGAFILYSIRVVLSCSIIFQLHTGLITKKTGHKLLQTNINVCLE